MASSRVSSQKYFISSEKAGLVCVPSEWVIVLAFSESYEQLMFAVIT